MAGGVCIEVEADVGRVRVAYDGDPDVAAGDGQTERETPSKVQHGVEHFLVAAGHVQHDDHVQLTTARCTVPDNLIYLWYRQASG